MVGEFDSPAGYEMSSGGSVLNPTVTLTAPDDLTGMPKKIEIRAIAEADVDGVISVVHQDTLILNVEKIDVYQPPVASIWSEDHKTPIANSSRGMPLTQLYQDSLSTGSSTHLYSRYSTLASMPIPSGSTF